MSPARLLPLAALAAVLSSLAPVRASAKVGPDQVPNGADGVMAGFLPPPGVHFLNNTSFVQGTRRNGDGHEVVTSSGVPRLSGVADIVRLVWVSERKLLGGNFAMQLVAPFCRNQLNAAAAGAGAPTIAGMGDVQIAPAMLGWHFGPRTHLWAMLGIFVPMGGPGLTAGYASMNPTLLGTHVFGFGTELSGKVAYNLKAVNPTTSYRSGDEFLADFFVGQHVGRATLGVGGYYVAQTSFDRNRGALVTGTWTKGLAFGPQVAYLHDRTGFALLWDRDVVAENRFKGDRVIFKISQPL